MKIVQIETPKSIVGKSIQSKHDIEMNPANSRITPLWQTFFQEGGTSSIPEAKSQAIYAVYNDYESDVTGMYTLTLGAESDANPSDLKKEDIPTGNYLVFEGKGAIPNCTLEAWQEVWAYFANEDSEYKRSYTTDFELYTGPEGVSIYINID